MSAIGPQQIERMRMVVVLPAPSGRGIRKSLLDHFQGRLLTARMFPYRLVSPRMEIGATSHSRGSRAF